MIRNINTDNNNNNIDTYRYNNYLFIYLSNDRYSKIKNKVIWFKLRY